MAQIYQGLGGYLFGLFQVSLRKALKKHAVLVMPWLCRDSIRGGWDLYGMEIDTKHVLTTKRNTEIQNKKR